MGKEYDDNLDEIEALHNYFTKAESQMHKACDLIRKSSSSLAANRSRDYLLKLSMFTTSLASHLESFAASMSEGEYDNLHFIFPAGLEPRSLFYPREDQIAS